MKTITMDHLFDYIVWDPIGVPGCPAYAQLKQVSNFKIMLKH